MDHHIAAEAAVLGKTVLNVAALAAAGSLGAIFLQLLMPNSTAVGYIEPEDRLIDIQTKATRENPLNPPL